MFSLNSINNQNQILISISQITRHSQLFKNKKNTGRNKDGKRKTETLQEALIHDDTIVCSESLVETIKNCDRNFFNDLRKTDVRVASSVDRCGKRIPGYGESSLKEFPEINVPWRVSYVSGKNFEENKSASNMFANIMVDSRSRRNRSADKFVGVITRKICDRNVQFNVQVRGFKTTRSATADRKRNPNLLDRIRNTLGLSSHTSESLPPSSTPQAAMSKNVRLERLLASEEQTSSSRLNIDQKDKIKIAFAEGYLAGSYPENKRGGKGSKYMRMMQQVLAVTIILAVFISLVATVSGTVFRIQIGNQAEVDPEEISVTFDDVKGADEAKQELKDVVEFLKSPSKFSTLGGKLPKGVLLVGPPGTGKTLLARAVAGEAGVPFFHAAGPEFDEVLVGQGARRVRNLFKAAKERAPCVIFIDEIDSVGAKRTNSSLHPYANQTINQLLAEMDGFHQNEGVIVLGATNRRDDLDVALLRPGRFDVEVNVPTPDYGGRAEILQLYLSRVTMHVDVDVDMLARGTTGFTGADLENMINQAALKAAIDGAKYVSMKYLENARDKVLMGPERRCRIPDEEANLITAYHEGGHAIVAYYTKESHPLHKVTIIPRGPSLGHTAYIPAKESYHVTKQQLLAIMDTMMGGRAAEELVFGSEKITAGASSDLKKATSIAMNMVKDWGMSERVGLRTLDSSKGVLGGGEQLGPHTNEMVDAEIKRILSESYERAKLILKVHAKEHKALAEALLKYETLDADDIKAIVNGDKLKLETLARPKKEVITSIAPTGQPTISVTPGTPTNPAATPGSASIPV